MPNETRVSCVLKFTFGLIGRVLDLSRVPYLSLTQLLFCVLERGSLSLLLSINRLFAYCQGGNFNIHIWVWFGYFICLTREIRFYLLFSEEIISCLGRANVRAFHENPNCIHTEFTLITLKVHNHKIYIFVVF